MTRMHVPTLLLIVTASLFFITNNSVDAAALTRDLSSGSVGEDVRDLQIFLNSNTSTSISGTGDGSKGKETTYFGSLTAAAVMRFQGAHPDETYKKAGLSAPNGYVGVNTRNLINSMMGYSVTAAVVSTPSTPYSSGSGYIYDPFAVTPSIKPAPSISDPVRGASSAYSDAFMADLDAFVSNNSSLFVAPTASTSTTSATTSEPSVTFLNVNSAKVGDVITIFGLSLPKDLIIELDGYNIKTQVNEDGTRATFTLPKRAEDEYDVTFSSKSKKAIVFPKKMKLRVIPESASSPTVLDYPAVMQSGQKVTITGTHFDTEGKNVVYTALGKVDVMTTSDTKLEFKVPTFSQAIKKDIAIPQQVVFDSGFIMVENDYGRSAMITGIKYLIQ